MRTITIWLMRLNLKIAINKKQKEKNSIIEHAYRDLIKSYEDTIRFLEAQRHSSFVAFTNIFKNK